MKTNRKNTAISAVLMASLVSPLVAFPAAAKVESMQAPYKNLLEKVYQVQTGGKQLQSQLFYHLPKEALVENGGETPSDKFASWNKNFTVADQKRIIESLVSQQTSEQGSDSGLFNRETLKANPVTLVIVPGVFGEFIEPYAFNEVMAEETPSAMKRDFAAKIDDLKKQGPCQSGNEKYCDSFFSLQTQTLGAQEMNVVPLDQLLSVASIDDKDGKPLVKLVLFKTPRMSMESMGNIGNIAGIFQKRLKKYFSIVGEPTSYAFVGYSRGTMVALEMLNQSQDPRVKALFSVGGVTMGADGADQAYIPGTLMNQQLVALQKLVSGLELTHNKGTIMEPITFVTNCIKYLDFFRQLGVINVKMSPAASVTAIRAFLRDQLLISKSSNVNSTFALILSVAFHYGIFDNIDGIVKIGMKAIKNPGYYVFPKNSKQLAKEFKHMITDNYSLDIARLKVMADQAAIAVQQMTTPARLEWWKNAQLPKGLKFYVFAGTMADQHSKESPEEAELGRTQLYSGPLDGADYFTMIQGYRDMKKVSGSSLNDSQVTVEKVIAWPELIKTLNPRIELQTNFLALFGAHHWAIALPVVTVRKDGALNPFPRAAFLESMAHVLVNSK